MFQVIVVLLSCQLFDFNYLSLSNIFNFIKQVVIDHYACVEYLTKYAAKGEPRSPILKQAFNSIVQNVDNNTDPHRAIKKIVMKSLGERDYAAQETMHHLLSLNSIVHHLKLFQ